MDRGDLLIPLSPYALISSPPYSLLILYSPLDDELKVEEVEEVDP